MTFWLFNRGNNADHIPADSNESQPLLDDSHRGQIEVSVASSLCSSTACDSHYPESSTDGSETDSEDSDDDADIQSYRKTRLQSGNGGFIQYLRSFSIFWPYVWPHSDRRFQFYFLILCFSTLAQRALNVLAPRQFGIVVEALYSSFGSGMVPWKEIALWLSLEALANDTCGLPAINLSLEERIERWSHLHLSLAAFEHVMGLSVAFHDNKDSGEVIRAIEQSDSLNTLLRMLFLDTTPVVLDLVIACWYISHLLDVSAILVVVFVVVSFSTVSYLITLLLTKSRRVSASKSRQESKVIYEAVSNWPTISYFNRSKHEQQRLARVVRASIDAGQWNDDVQTILAGAQELCTISGRALISILAAYRVGQGLTSVGNFSALERYWDIITLPLWIMGHNYRQLSNDLIDAERLLQLFETKSDIQDAPEAKPLVTVGGGRIDFRNVGFSYSSQTARPTLSDVNFSISPGQTIALVGETGSGKSTTLKILMRFYDPDVGSVMIDGQDIRQVTVSSLRDYFGFVPQQAALFNTSILENVRYGRLDATDEEVYRACEAACIHEKILTFPKGYDTKVGERGVKLSGGELQRVAIARVILRNPKVVLLDEATSSLDSDTEAQVQEALVRLTAGKTTVVIAHRLSTITRADCILVVDNGRILEQGSHQELIDRGGKYAHLWKRQTLGQMEKLKEESEQKSRLK